MPSWKGVMFAGVLALVGCAQGSKATKVSTVEPPKPPVDTSARYVDTALGFEVVRPTDRWAIDVSGEAAEQGIATPVVLRNLDTGAQVVIQVAPAMDSPVTLAERLTDGMRAQPGFVTSDPEPVPLSDDAVGFHFSMGDKVLGRVAVRRGAPGRVLMILATWPKDAPEATGPAVDAVFRGVTPLAPDGDKGTGEGRTIK
jgi:hypothetical protein